MSEPEVVPVSKRSFDPEKHCGGSGGRRTSDDEPGPHMSQGKLRMREGGGRGEPCRLPKGWGTDHKGYGRCRKHAGSSPNGAVQAAREAAASALERLGVPVGTGDPFVLLSKAVAHAEGHLEATAAMVREAAESARAAEQSRRSALALSAAAEMYERAIRDGARVGKAAVDANVADRLVALDERMESLLWRFLQELFDRVVPARRRPQEEAWASQRLADLAREYEQVPGVTH